MGDIVDSLYCFALESKLSYQLLSVRPLHHFCKHCLNHPTFVPQLRNVLFSYRLCARLQSNKSQNLYGLGKITSYKDQHLIIENKTRGIPALGSSDTGHRAM